MIAKKHIPNALTIARYVVLPLLVGAWYLPAPWGLWLPFALFVLACITDFFDGYLARKWKVTSDLGRLLDPNADKLLVAVSLLLLSERGMASPIAVSLILCRELFVSGLREFMAERNITLHVTKLAKWKTTTQMIACATLLWAIACGCEGTAMLGNGLLWMATLLTLITGWRYWRSVWIYLRS